MLAFVGNLFENNSPWSIYVERVNRIINSCTFFFVYLNVLPQLDIYYSDNLYRTNINKTLYSGNIAVKLHKK